MRKFGFFSIIFTLVAMLVVSGCGTGANNGRNANNGSETAPVNSNAEEEGWLKWDAAANDYVMEPEIASSEQPLKIWVEYEDYGKALVEAFKVKYPQVKVEYEIIAKVESVDLMALDGEAGKARTSSWRTTISWPKRSTTPRQR